MSSATLTIPATTSPFAALLAGYGLARWLRDLAEQVTGATATVRVGASGSGVTVTADRAIDLTQVMVAHSPTRLPPWILTAKNGPKPDGLRTIDYDAQRQHNADYFAERARLTKAGSKLTELQEQELAERAPLPEWPVVAFVNQMGAIGAYNKAVERWRDCKAIYPDLVALIWTMGSGAPDAMERAQRAWVDLAKAHGLDKNAALPATQIVNPDQGKGANRAKADALTIGGRESFWLLEYFKFAGLYEAALPRTVRERKDRKTYVVVPTQAGTEWRWHEGIFREFQREFWANSAIKMDILAVLSYTDVLLTQWEGAQSSSGRRRRVSDYAEGFVVASYKDLGSAVAVMNVASMGLPDWVAWPRSTEEAQRLRAVIENHRRLIGALDESRSDEERLLRDYRDFLSSRDPALRAFFAFTTGYAAHLLRLGATGTTRRSSFRLATDDLEAIVMAQEEARVQKLKPILDAPGFRRIARAIRQSTVTQQYFKTVRGDNTYEVRYGLAHDLQRASREPGEFAQVLATFITEYSQENARVMERAEQRGESYRRRVAITTADIAEVVALIDDYHAPTVAGLLVAFGYARDPRETDDGTDERVGTSSGDSNADDAQAAADDEDSDNLY